MKKIDLFTDSQRVVHPLYMGAQMPLFICHSTEEFEEVTKNDELKPIVLHNAHEFVEYLKSRKYLQQLKNYPIHDESVWLTTNEIYVPNVQLTNGMILYEVGNNGNPIPTDNCYIQVVGVFGVNNAFHVATSSGMHYISLLEYDVTAAVKTQYRGIHKQNGRKVDSNQQRLEKMFTRKAPNAQDVKFVHYLLRPDAPVSESIYTAGKSAYGNTTSKKTIEALLKTQRIKNLFIEEARKVVPDLREALLSVYPLEELAKDMKQMVKKTVDVESKDFDQEAAEKALTFVTKQLDLPQVINPLQQTALTAGTQPGMIQAGNAKLQTFDASIKKINPESAQREEIPVLDAETQRKLEDELAVPTGYVAKDGLGRAQEIKRIYDEDGK